MGFDPSAHKAVDWQAGPGSISPLPFSGASHHIVSVAWCSGGRGYVHLIHLILAV